MLLFSSCCCGWLAISNSWSTTIWGGLEEWDLILRFHALLDVLLHNPHKICNRCLTLSFRLIRFPLHKSWNRKKIINFSADLIAQMPPLACIDNFTVITTPPPTWYRNFNFSSCCCRRIFQFLIYCCCNHDSSTVLLLLQRQPLFTAAVAAAVASGLNFMHHLWLEYFYNQQLDKIISQSTLYFSQKEIFEAPPILRFKATPRMLFLLFEVFEHYNCIQRRRQNCTYNVFWNFGDVSFAAPTENRS